VILDAILKPGLKLPISYLGHSMIPPTNHPVWRRLITAEKNLQSSNVGINMLLFNSTMRYKRDPSTANLNQLVSHAHEYFTKFEKVLPAEVKQLLS
jgi:hypothetical protein